MTSPHDEPAVHDQVLFSDDGGDKQNEPSAVGVVVILGRDPRSRATVIVVKRMIEETRRGDRSRP